MAEPSDPDRTLTDVEINQCSDYLRRCGEALREDVKRNNGRMPAVQRCPHPQNDIEEIALQIWMGTVADGMGVPVMRGGYQKTHDA